ncbi:MAG: hypothetical protein CW691_02830 [Candidatus Bathyarchaeum sp.]|nr:MAG: hypothetical protein CW691_02830 [Candidatus Bathyarchaeum sp.]
MKCIICDKESTETYCVLHQEVYLNIVQKFEAWKRAAGVSWKQYLKELVENSYTGTWAKEVAEHLLNNKDG